MTSEASPLVEKHFAPHPSSSVSRILPAASIISLWPSRTANPVAGVSLPGHGSVPDANAPNVHATHHGQADCWPSKGVKRFANGQIKPQAAMNPQYNHSASLPSAALPQPQQWPQAPNGNASASENSQGHDAAVQAKTASLVAAMGVRPNAGPFTQTEDALLVHLKEVAKLTWPQIHTHFPHRNSWHTLQSRYSNRLNRNRRPRTKQAQSLPSDSDADTDLDARAVQRSPIAGRSYRLRNERQVDYFPEALESQGFESLLAASGQAAEQAPSRRSAFPKRRTTKINPSHQPPTNHTQALRALERSRDDAAIAAMLQKVAHDPAKTNLHDSIRLQSTGRKAFSRPRASQPIPRPYLGAQERAFLMRSTGEQSWDQDLSLLWNSRLLHADFTQDEISILKRTMQAVTPKPIHEVSSSEIREIASRSISRGPFLNRSVSSIENFLQDASCAQVNRQRRILRIGERRPGSSINRILRQREMGLGAHPPARSRLRHRLETTFGPSHRFKVMSHDVNAIAWAPDSLSFAVGATALTDVSSMQYNNPYNLLVGNRATGRLRELPQHTVPRQADVGINATEAMRKSQDPYLFTTISAVDYSADGKIMFSAGYDNCVRLWEVGQDVGDVCCKYRVPTRSKVDALSVGPKGLFAVATQSTGQAIKLYEYKATNGHLEDCRKSLRFCSQAASQWPSLDINPSCVRWAPGTHYARYLLGGFASVDDAERRGETCLWDIESGQPMGLSVNKRHVFDVAWSPSIFGRFAVGCSASGNVNRGTKSVIQIYDFLDLPATAYSGVGMAKKHHFRVELECPAFDMNDVLMNRSDSYMVAAGCTDGCVYLWDLRRPDQTLHTFEHGSPLAELDHQRSREDADTGVRFMSWSSDGRRLFTGSSDGVVSLWDPYVNSKDAHVQSIAQLDSGIMAGKFSPDFSSLLVGDVQGSLVMLSVGQEAAALDEAASFDFQTASPAELPEQPELPLEDESGVEASKRLVLAGQIDIRPYGTFPKKQAVQGLNYDGPHDNAPDSESLRQAAAESQARATVAFASQVPLEDPALAFEQDIHDEKHWTQRIPGSLRRDKAGLLDTSTQPRISCFRCRDKDVLLSATTSISAGDLLECPACEAAWQPNVLGYDLVRQGRARDGRRSARPASARGLLEPVETLDFYHDLWS